MKKYNLSSLFIIPLCYAYLCGVLYSYAFWDNIDINLIQFLSLSDILNSLLLPSILTLPIIFSFIIVIYFMTPTQKEENYITRENIKKIYNEHNLKSILNTLCRNKLIVLNAIVSLVALLTQIILIIELIINFGKAMLITFLILIISSIITYLSRNVISKYLGSLKFSILILIPTLPTLSYYIGTTDSIKITSGEDYYIIETIPSCSSDGNERFRYLATTSDKIFAISEKDNSICVSRYHTIKLIKKNKFKNKNSIDIGTI